VLSPNELPPLLRDSAERKAALISLLLLGASGFVPQFGGPGYESALAGGVVLPSAAAIGSALCVARYRPSAFDAYGRGAALGAILALLGVALASLHGLRTGFCDAAMGYELWLTGPGPGAVLGGVWGSMAGLGAGIFRRPNAASVLLALAGPLGGILLSLLRFYTSPMVFGLDPFFGYFAGPLYDTVVEPGSRLLSYRVGSVASLLAGAALVLHVERSGERGFRLRWLGRPGVVAAGGVALALSLGVSFAGAQLGHFSTVSSIEQALGRSLTQARCRIVYSAGIPVRDAERVARECNGHLLQIERYFEAKGPDKVTVFLFGSDAEKGALMGASRTYIAKPWRAETYVQAAGFPHPTLGHELAHVVSRSFGVGPFRVAGPLGGWIPDPGRIEGFAVAASPGEDDDFTLLEWSKALLDLGLLPEMESVFRLGFLAKSSTTAYTVAGAFVSWLHERYGARAIRDWYGGGDISRYVGGKSMAQLDREFRGQLGKIQLRPELLAMAKARFDRPSIFGRVCPRRVDRDLGLAESKLAAGDVRGAREGFQGLLAIDRDNTRAKLGLANCEVRDGQLDRAVSRYHALARDPALSRLEQVAALEASGDVQLMAGRLPEARAAYDEVALVDADEDRQRTLDVKRATNDPELRRAIVELLVGDPRTGPSWDEAAPRLGALERGATDGLPAYLLGRNLWGHGRVPAALSYLDRSIALGTSLLRVQREALRLRLIAGCAEPRLDRAPAAAALRALLEDPGLSAAKRQSVARFAVRCGLEPG
jgi:tetratricopeptide (TPR) repeat protein